MLKGNMIFNILLVVPLILTHCLAADEDIMLTDQEKQALLDAHNLLRAKTARGETGQQPPATNMILMEWNEELANGAKQWATKCKLGKKQPRKQRRITGYKFVGQNVGYSNNVNDSIQVITWKNEERDYNYTTNKCTTSCQQYGQLAWANSVMVGCAVAKCENKRLLVCNYAPRQKINKKKPYKAGNTCTQCPAELTFCMGGLCASKRQCERVQAECVCTIRQEDCMNGGTFNSSACMCKCPKGFYGSRCHLKCKNRKAWDYTCKSKVSQDMELCTKGYAKHCKETCELCSDQLDIKMGSPVPRVLGAGGGLSTSTSTTPTGPTTSTTSSGTTASTIPDSTITPSCTDFLGTNQCSLYKDQCTVGQIRVLCGKTCNSCEDQYKCKDWTYDCATDQCWCPIRKAVCKETCKNC